MSSSAKEFAELIRKNSYVHLDNRDSILMSRPPATVPIYNEDAVVVLIAARDAEIIEETRRVEAEWWAECGSDREGEISDVGRDRLAALQPAEKKK